MQHIVVTGNPVDGLQFTGPYEDAEEARTEAEAFGAGDGGEWWVAPLNPTTEQQTADALAAIEPIKAPGYEPEF